MFTVQLKLAVEGALALVCHNLLSVIVQRACVFNSFAKNIPENR